MLSGRMLQLIESHWDEIASRLITAIRKHPEMQNLAKRPDMELREWCREVLRSLQFLLSGTRAEEANRRFEVLGRMRFEENIPLHEAILRTQLLKDKIIGLVHEQGLPMTAMHLYAEEELEQRIGWFFDGMVYHIVRGYEEAWSVARRVA